MPSTPVMRASALIAKRSNESVESFSRGGDGGHGFPLLLFLVLDKSVSQVRGRRPKPRKRLPPRTGGQESRRDGALSRYWA